MAPQRRELQAMDNVVSATLAAANVSAWAHDGEQPHAAGGHVAENHGAPRRGRVIPPGTIPRRRVGRKAAGLRLWRAWEPRGSPTPPPPSHRHPPRGAGSPTTAPPAPRSSGPLFIPGQRRLGPRGEPVGAATGAWSLRRGPGVLGIGCPFVASMPQWRQNYLNTAASWGDRHLGNGP
jgi:hypothetical protein